MNQDAKPMNIKQGVPSSTVHYAETECMEDTSASKVDSLYRVMCELANSMCRLDTLAHDIEEGPETPIAESQPFHIPPAVLLNMLDDGPGFLQSIINHVHSTVDKIEGMIYNG